jgi:hypothetical protein
MSYTIKTAVVNGIEYCDEYDVPSFLKFKSSINIIKKEKCVRITKADVDANVCKYNGMVNRLDVDATIPIAIDNNSVEYVVQPKWWSHTGRYILCVIVSLCAFYVLDSIVEHKAAEDKEYYASHHAWYMDDISDDEFKSVKDRMFWH